jgi:hypothetical protein
MFHYPSAGWRWYFWTFVAKRTTQTDGLVAETLFKESFIIEVWRLIVRPEGERFRMELDAATVSVHNLPNPSVAGFGFLG